MIRENFEDGVNKIDKFNTNRNELLAEIEKLNSNIETLDDKIADLII